jgi:RNA polymerase sigma-54 factor
VCGLRLTPGLVLRQTQKLVMSPQLRLAFQILRLPAAELADRIQEELLANPAVEIAEEEAREREGEPGRNDEVAAPDEPASGGADFDWREYFSDRDRGELGLPPSAGRDRGFAPEAAVAEVPTLRDHLILQLVLATPPGIQRRVVEHLIGCLDRYGYLICELEDTAAFLGVTVADVERGIALLQTFDPAGVGARDLRECLALQLAAKGWAGGAAAAIVAHHLDDLAAGRLGRIADSLGVSLAEAQAAVDRVRALDPRPAGNFAGPDEGRYVVADAAIERVGDEYVVVMNDSAVPRLTLNPFYRRLLAGTPDSAGAGAAGAGAAGAGAAPRSEEVEFLRGRLNSAVWFIRSIEQRRLTLYRVIEAVAALQHDFLEGGVRRLRPQTLRDVADRIGVHESTVSRAVAGKYVHTPHGLFELRFFFSSGVDQLGGQGIAAGGVKKLMGDLVTGEDPKHPHTDARLAELLATRFGVAISRRTVAKYREEAGIPSSNQRKRYT